MGNSNIKIVQEPQQEKTVPAPPKTTSGTVDVTGKRCLRNIKKDYEKCKKEFMEKSTQQIRELIAKLGQSKTEEEKAQINNTIDLIKKEMENYTTQKTKLAPPKKEKTLQQPYPRTYNKKYEVCLEEVVKELQNYPSLIGKLKVTVA